MYVETPGPQKRLYRRDYMKRAVVYPLGAPLASVN